ncbi:oligosaccharide flippase family protein, partial [Klebsiella pneumoniae]
VRLNGIVLLIGTIALGAVGQFNLAWQSMQVPIGLINGAISQVFFERLARVERGSMRPLVRATIKRAFLLGLPPFIIIYIIAP